MAAVTWYGADGQQPPLLRPHPREEPRHVPGQEEGEQSEAADPGLLQQPHRVLDTTNNITGQQTRT